METAVAAMENWDGIDDPENGWERHLNSGRRRPGGDISKEYVSD